MRANPPALITYPFRTSHDLRYADMDTNGHVNNGAFGSLMETNRSLLFLKLRAAGQTEAERAATTTVLARFEIDYLREMAWPATIVAASGVERLGGASFVLRQALFVGEDCAALARSTCVIMDRSTRRAARLGDALRREMAAWATTDTPLAMG